MTHLHLYSTSHCHLCELAETLLKDLVHQYAFDCLEIEIIEAEHLLTRYGTLIPVISEPSTGLELCWPFITEDIVKTFKLKPRRLLT